MKFDSKTNYVAARWFVFLLALLMVSALAWSQHNKSAPPPPHQSAPPPHQSAPPPPHQNAPPPHQNAPAPRPSSPSAGGHTSQGNAQRPTSPTTGGNRTGTQTGATGMNRNAGTANANRTGAGTANANRNATGANASRTGGANANANRTGGANANANRGGTNANANRSGGANANANRGAAGANGANNRGAANNRGGNANTRTAARQQKPDRTVHVGNKTATFRPDGRVRTIQTKGMVINHGLHGRSMVVTERNGHRLVSMGRRGGYLERPYLRRNGRAYVQRSYYMGGRRYAYAYRSYYWRGRPYYGYAPAYYYRPAYYQWAYQPWPGPAYYRWGYYQDPWYTNYNYYYRPYPSYPSASPWLTDYMFSEQLRQAYEARLNAAAFPQWPALYASLAPPAAAADGATPLSREVKQMVTEEVKQQLAAEQQASGAQQAAGGGDETPKALDPSFTVFIVSSNLDVTGDDGQECELTPGDVITRTSDTPGADNKVSVQVNSSKKDDCAGGTNAQVDVSDLQEMFNHFQEMLDAGLKSLAENQGKGGLPTAPDTSTTAGEVPPPTADDSVQSDLQAQQQEADQAEQQVTAAGQGADNQ
ncbi:MAG: hypothetical protein LAN63_02440 [Acidobacteriia bacterium]|nr:hypothetical protein [Terriglobia bacterium]